jgi:hypothetical protein
MNEDATEERLVELAFSDGKFCCLQGWEVERAGSETGDEVGVGDAGAGRSGGGGGGGGGKNEEALMGEIGIAWG